MNFNVSGSHFLPCHINLYVSINHAYLPCVFHCWFEDEIFGSIISEPGSPAEQEYNTDLYSDTYAISVALYLDKAFMDRLVQGYDPFVTTGLIKDEN